MILLFAKNNLENQVHVFGLLTALYKKSPKLIQKRRKTLKQMTKKIIVGLICRSIEPYYPENLPQSTTNYVKNLNFWYTQATFGIGSM